jgi:hypothetical protein
MADVTEAKIKESGHKPDKSEATGAGHCPHCAEHEGRISAVEAKLGIKKEPGVSKEEASRERKRH